MIYYKGYRVGTLEKSILKLLLGVGNVEFPVNRNRFSDDRWSLIFKTYRQKTEMPFVVNRLKEKGLVYLVSKNGQLFISLTAEGKLYIRDNFLFADTLIVTKNKQWDKKWHIVIFDIPESQRKVRNMVRINLKKIGFAQVQASVWVYPFECEETIMLIKTNFKFTREILYVIADSIEGDTVLKKKFKI